MGEPQPRPAAGEGATGLATQVWGALETIGLQKALRGQLDDCASPTRTRIAGGLGFEIIRVAVHDQSPTHHIRHTRTHRDGGGLKAQAGMALCVGHQGGQISRMVSGLSMRTMGMAQRVEMPTCAHAVSAAAIALFVDMKPMLGTRLQAADLGLDQNLGTHGREAHLTRGGVALGGRQSGHGHRPRHGGSTRHQSKNRQTGPCFVHIQSSK